MSIKKYSNGAWSEVGYKKYETATDTITSLPKTIIGDGQPITSYTIKGAMSQSGTPTPTNPIYPQECGDKTANLYDANATNTSNGYINGMYLSTDGTTYTPQGANASVTEYIPVNPSQVYSQANFYVGSSGTPAICFYDTTKTYISGLILRDNPSFTTPSNASYIRLSRTKTNSESMLNTGSTALPYEPFGYKIPILSGNTTTNVYLGEMQSTRNIKKLVLTGQEAWGRNSGNSVLYLSIADGGADNTITSMCTDYPAIANVSAYASMSDKTICIKTDGSAIWIRDTNIASTTDFKTYLAQQYAAGTPITVWYVLSTPTTGTVNEPIRKIGNYADSVTGTGLPTTGTAEQFDVDTTLKPSEVSLTYHGWHEHSDEKYVGGVINKFNYLTMVMPWYISTQGNIALSSVGSYSIIVPCKPNTLYTCIYPQEPSEHLIRYGSTANYPTINEFVTKYSAEGYGGTSSQYTTGTTANYMIVFLYNVAAPPSMTPEEFFSQVMVIEDSIVPSEYHPYYEWVED